MKRRRFICLVSVSRQAREAKKKFISLKHQRNFLSENISRLALHRYTFPTHPRPSQSVFGAQTKRKRRISCVFLDSYFSIAQRMCPPYQVDRKVNEEVGEMGQESVWTPPAR